jgi:hypothetical protein
MAEPIVPYITAYGNITKALEKIQQASVPDRFTQDFLATKLGMKGGSPRPVIPFFKRIGFLASDGVPTNRYKRFRNPTQRGAAAAEAMREGFAALYEVNEYAHDLNDTDLKGLVIQVTELEGTNPRVKAMVESFKGLKSFADFEAEPSGHEESTEAAAETDDTLVDGVPQLKLGYTINLNLPATSDVAVFNAIFKSLREHLLK